VAVVELVALGNAEIKYSTVQNWYPGDENGLLHVWAQGDWVTRGVFGALLLRHHWTIVTMPIPLDLYEGTMPLIMGTICIGLP